MKHFNILIIQFVITISLCAQNRNGVTTQHDNLGRITEQVYYDSIRVSYQYDATGNRTKRTIACVRLQQSQRRDTICEGDTIRVGQNRYFATGNYRDTFRFTTKCDSVLQTNLFVKRNERIQKDTSICNGDTLSIGKSIYTLPSTIRDTIALNTEGVCLRISTTQLSVNPRFDRNTSICQGNFYNFYGQTLNSSGIYKKTFVSNRGCDSAIYLTLSVVTPRRRVFDTTICNGNILELGDRFFTSAGRDSVTLRSSGGCDSLKLVFNLNVYVNIPRDTTVTICSGDSFRFGNRFLRSAGAFTEVLRTRYGCDSTVRLNLRVVSRPQLSFTAQIDSSRLVRFIHNSRDFTSLLWVFGDGTSLSSNFSVPHLYPRNDSFKVLLIGSNGVCTDTFRQTIVVPNCSSSKGSFSFEPATCGLNNGRVWATELNTKISWNNRIDTAFRNLVVGTYPIAVQWGACEIRDTVRITMASPAARCTVLVNPNGSVVARATQGTPPFNFRWQDGNTDSLRFGLRRDSINVVMTDSKGCRDSFRIFYNATQEIEGLENFTISPNPTSGNLLVQGQFQTKTDFECQLISTIGQTVWQHPLSKSTVFRFNIDISNQTSGTYFFLLKSRGQVNSYPIILQH